MDGFVSAYSKTTGRKQRIPAHWVGHPVLGRNFEVTPSTKAAVVEETGPPSESWTRQELDEHAGALGLDTTGLPNKGEVLAAIEAAAAGANTFVGTVFEVDDTNQDSGGTPSPDQTPVTGEEEE